jgi:hypothetical protein
MPGADTPDAALARSAIITRMARSSVVNFSPWPASSYA